MVFAKVTFSCAGLRFVAHKWIVSLYKRYKRGKVCGSIYSMDSEASPPVWIFPCVLVLLLLLNGLISVVFFMYFQSLSFLDSFYMIFIFITTVGYGDIVPEIFDNVYVLILFYGFLGMPFLFFYLLFSETADILQKK